MHCLKKLIKTRLALIVCLVLLCLSGLAQNSYDIGLIPEVLRSSANATIRNEEITVNLESPQEVNYLAKKAITILNKNGDDHAGLVLFYDKNTAIKAIKGEIYNEFGKLISKFSQSDFSDESAVQHFSLFEDNRVKHYFPTVNTYPYTVVYQYEIRYKQNLIIPAWRPRPSADVSIAKSSYTLICKPNMQLRIKAQNYNGKEEEKRSEKEVIRIWQISKLSAAKPEPFGPAKENYETVVKVAPQQFTYFNHKGSYSNWQDLGKWIYEDLLKSRDVLPISTVETIRALVKDEANDKAKARKIYQFMQDKTRYISVQVGIGGFQPTPAAEVDRLGYGDCKGLVNYTQSLLKVAGIDSYYCVVEGGNQKVSLDPTFASMDQGNHIILCLPLAGDTTWLECTNQKIPFGYLGGFTDDRYVLACTPTGGKLLKTPKLPAAANSQIRRANLRLTSDGNISGELKTVFRGAQYTNNEQIMGKPIAQQQDLLKEVYDVDNINFKQINYVLQKQTGPELTEQLDVEIKNYGAVNGERMFLIPNVFNISDNVPEIKNRTLPVYINRGFIDLDTVSYELPANATLLTVQNDKHISNEYGEYDVKVRMENNRLIYTRKLLVNEGTFPPESYATFSRFMADVSFADRLKLIFSLKK